MCTHNVCFEQKYKKKTKTFFLVNVSFSSAEKKCMYIALASFCNVCFEHVSHILTSSTFSTNIFSL